MGKLSELIEKEREVGLKLREHERWFWFFYGTFLTIFFFLIMNIAQAVQMPKALLILTTTVDVLMFPMMAYHFHHWRKHLAKKCEVESEVDKATFEIFGI